MGDLERNALLAVLRGKEREARRLGKANQRTALLLMICAISASAAAGIAGLGGLLKSSMVGIIALLPGFIALLATTVKFDERARWHYKRKRRMDALAGRLEFEMPSPPTADQLALIHKEKAKIDEELDREWDRTFALNFNSIGGRRQRHRGNTHDPSI
jgi:hypothetical protein